MDVTNSAPTRETELGPLPKDWEVTRLIQILREHFPKLSERYKIKSLEVFGSYVRDQQRDESDLDLLVEFHEPPSLLEFIHLENELSDLLSVKVDLVMKSALRPAIGRASSRRSYRYDARSRRYRLPTRHPWYD
jgi:predicted nucleotidyltransferase